MCIDWDDSEDTWYCTVCVIDLEHGDYEKCPSCGQ